MRTCLAFGLSLAFIPLSLSAQQKSPVERKTCAAPDGVPLVYSVTGSGEPALVFVHGGLADRSFFDGQLAAFGGRHRVIALDLAGHGESGTGRRKWGIAEFGQDIKAVVEAERSGRVILFGNSLGGPAAVEAALLLGDRVVGVVGIDTFQDLAHPQDADYASRATEFLRARAEAFRTDYTGSVKSMAAMLFHKDADPVLMADVERRMMKTSPDAAYAMLSSVVDYDPIPAARRLTVPLRAINGDLFPTDVPAIRKVKADFDAVKMEHTGHYPMLEKPAEFNRHVEAVIEALGQK